MICYFYAEGKAAQDFVDIHTATVENDYFTTLGVKIINEEALFRKLHSRLGLHYPE
jgi:hypothetical protein